METRTTTKPSSEKTDDLVTAGQEYEAILASFQSIQLGTVSPDGLPEASYAPATTDNDRSFYVYVSELSSHTANLLQNRRASVMIIEDESKCANLFARRRVTFDCHAFEIERSAETWEALMDGFVAKFGSTMHMLRKMEDFHLIRLRPENARLVLGFGRAYDISGERLDVVEHVKGINGGGHRKEKKA